MKVSDDSTRSILIKHALLLISQLGAHAVSLREIARSVGISHMAPYKHFVNKEALFATIVEDGFTSLNDRFKVVEQSVHDPEKRYQKMCEVYVRFAMENPEQYKLMFSGFLGRDRNHQGIKVKSEDCFSYLVRLMEYCQFHKFIKAGNISEISLFIWSQIHGFSNLWIEGCFLKIDAEMSPSELDKLIQHQIKMTLTGVSNLN